MNKFLLVLFAAALTTVGCSTQKTTTPATTKQDNTQRPARNGERPSTDEVFAQLDANKDGKLTKAEVKGPLANNFDKIDANGDGLITKEEMAKAPKPQRGQGGGRPGGGQ